MLQNLNKKIKVDVHAWSMTGALTSAFFVLLVSLMNSVGLNKGATQALVDLGLYSAPDVQGTVLGMIEAAILAYIMVFVFLSVHAQVKRK